MSDGFKMDLSMKKSRKDWLREKSRKNIRELTIRYKKIHPEQQIMHTVTDHLGVAGNLMKLNEEPVILLCDNRGKEGGLIKLHHSLIQKAFNFGVPLCVQVQADDERWYLYVFDPHEIIKDERTVSEKVDRQKLYKFHLQLGYNIEDDVL